MSHLKPCRGSAVLDLGCGTGNITSLLAERVAPESRVVGVDPDEERIDIAREGNKHTNVTFVAGDDQTFPED